MKSQLNREDLGVAVQTVKEMDNEGGKIIVRRGKTRKRERSGSRKNFIKTIQERVKTAGELICREKEKEIIRGDWMIVRNRRRSW